jgi:dihydroorotate dehydrogenase
MADLTTHVAGLTLRNPVVAASCEYTMSEGGIQRCLDAGAGAVIAKSINEVPGAAKQLSIADYTLLDNDFSPVEWSQATGRETLLNRSGLAQTPVDEWLGMLERSQRRAQSVGAAVISSITVASAHGAARLAAELAQVTPAIELNIGAPHAREGSAVRQVTEVQGVAHFTSTVRSAIDCPLIVKLPGQAGDIIGMAKAAVDNGADAVALIGRFNGFMPNLQTWKPELESWGAVGGNWALPISLYWVSKCHIALPSVPLLGTNGARDGLDIARFLLSGARAVEVASILMMHGAPALTDMLTSLENYLDSRDVTSVEEVVGAGLRSAREYADIEPVRLPPRPWTDVSLERSQHELTAAGPADGSTEEGS